MPIRPTKGKKQVNLELPEPLAEELETFARERGEKKGDVTAQALRRHMDNPPPPPKLPPLPPMSVPKKKGKS